MDAHRRHAALPGPQMTRPHALPIAGLALALFAPPIAGQTLDWTTARVAKPRCGHAMTYDWARQRVVTFGGHFRNGKRGEYLADTREWTGAQWLERTPANRPPGRTDHALAYDPGRCRTVLFGGRYELPNGDTVRLGDTWEWDGVDWRRVTPPASPAARYDHAMAWDPARGTVVLFGGRGVGSLDDTWEWDGRRWSLLTPASRPAPRGGHAMIHDPARGRIILFGGQVLGQRVGETWEWDGATWLRRAPATNPRGREGHSLAYDARRRRVVMFGGYGSGSPHSGDTWEYDGINWSRRAPANSPGARAWHAAAYHVATGRIVLLGGMTFDVSNWVCTADTWTWDDTTWTPRGNPNPPERWWSAMADQPWRQRVVMFGGWGTNHDGLADTWEWDGAEWNDATSPAAPPARHHHALSTDPRRFRVVLFGGWNGRASFGDTWEWDGRAWIARQPRTVPPPRRMHAMAWDPVNRRTLMFGGMDTTPLGDTWHWDGATWTRLQPVASPSSRLLHAMACDPRRGRVVLFGGWAANQPLNDTWEWDGARWLRLSPSAPPAPRGDHVMTYDAARGRVVMFGGRDAAGPLADTWEWDGAAWAPVRITRYPSPRIPAAGAFDAARRRTVMFGGDERVSSREAYLTSDTWLYGDITPAMATPIGAGWGGPSGPPVLASNEPHLAQRGFHLDLLGARPVAPAVIALAPSTRRLALGGGCTLYLQGSLLTLPVVSNATGFAAVALPVPGAGLLRGASFYSQAFVLDPRGPVLGLAFSAGRRLTVGD